MIEMFIDAFWLVATALVSLIVPITAIVIVFRLFYGSIFGGRRRD